MTTSPDDAVAQFTEQGFVLLKQAVPDSVVSTLDTAVRRLTDDRGPDLTHSSFNTNPALTHVRDAANIIAVYQQLFECGALMSVPHLILNGSLQVLGSEVLRRGIYQEAHEPWHRDSGPYLERPYDELNGPLHLKAQVFFTDTRPQDSGNLVLIPGSHRWPADHKDNAYWKTANDALAQGELPEGALSIHAEPGDAVVFGNTMWHAVLPNRTQERRSAIIRFGQAWLRPYDHPCDPATAAGHLSPQSRRLLGYHSNSVNPVDLYKDPTSTESWCAR
ncbi:phytanoyl-CoA dioxygenase family protein [Kitasatospora purpeofusca]|uniref:phytanoyl-CoA dioxygenase family protein n=1 Tax=Kitasatospora purpeofusca TaxID=67352 RepID=UPI00325606DD|nr:phytanoyl-CoA dioxygenase family protein [Kitasatospora purpeofusca]